jgi:CTP:molybdopterin cytidylyltransferase MocA
VDAVVMAAGEGRRLRPLTELWPKPVLPIDGKPVVATLLAELAAAGIERAWIVTGHLAEQVERIADEADPRPGLRFVRQPQALGSGDAVARALAAGAEPPLVVTAADTVFATGDLARFAAAGRAAVAWRRRPRGTPLRVEDGRVVRVPAAQEEQGRFAAPLWFLTEEVARRLDGLPGPPYELSAAFQRAIDAGTTVKGVEIGPTRDLTNPADLVRENFPYLETTTSDE